MYLERVNMVVADMDTCRIITAQPCFPGEGIFCSSGSQYQTAAAFGERLYVIGEFMNSNVARYGVILNTEHYAECVAFYRDLFGLRQLFEREDEGFKLTCLEFGHGDLMVEQGGKAKSGVKSPEEGSFKLRFNVDDLEEALMEIRSWGIQATITKNKTVERLC